LSIRISGSIFAKEEYRDMPEYLHDVGQLRMICETLRNNELEKFGFDKISNDLIKKSLGWLLEKQKQYSGEIYLEKIENNAIYLSEVAFACLDVATEYLCLGKPLIPHNEIDAFVWSARQNAFQPAKAHQDYVRHGCNGCLAHNKHERYNTLYQTRRNTTRETYLEEVEFWCICFQMKLIIVSGFLNAFLTNYDIAGIAQYLSVAEVHATLNERADITVQLLGKLLQFGSEIQPNAPQKTWREIWRGEIQELSSGNK
jgi:hypothetical protein